MAFQTNIPQSTDRKSKSQADMLGNFQALISWGNGYGNFTTQAKPVINITNISVWNNLNASTGRQELYLNRTGAAADVSFTAYATAVVADPQGNHNEAYTQLPSGVIMKWGGISTTLLYTGASATINKITFKAAPGFPAYTVAPHVMVTATRGVSAADPNMALYVSVKSATEFWVYCYARTAGAITNAPFQWTAIGV